MTNREPDCDLKMKVVLAGSTNVGKSNLLIRYTRDVFGGDLKTTIGVEFSAKKVQMKDGRTMKVQMWDTAGQERFRCSHVSCRSMAKAYYKGAVAALLVFDITSEQSFQNLNDWYKEVGRIAVTQLTMPARTPLYS